MSKLLANLMKSLNRNDRALRTAAPWGFAPRYEELLTVSEVAGMLRCSIDQARRIPRDQLPARKGPGKYLLYLKKDIMRYIEIEPIGMPSSKLGRASTKRIGRPTTRATCTNNTPNLFALEKYVKQSR
jgi:hypothetical protein